MKTRDIRTAVFALIVLATVASVGAQQPDFAVPMNMNSRGLMIGGYDPVAYIDYGEATPGFADNYLDYQNTFRFYFASKVTLKKFMGDPDRYLPAYGGHCAWIMATGKGGEGDLLRAEPKLFQVVDGRVYLFSNDEAMQEWGRDAAGAIARADANWDALIASRRQAQ